MAKLVCTVDESSGNYKVRPPLNPLPKMGLKANVFEGQW